MQDRIFRTLQRYITLAPGARLGVAVSGGADSVALLHLLCGPAAETRIGLEVVHVNHGLRDAESDADEAFVRDLAGSLGLPVHVLAGNMDPSSSGLEDRARRQRLAFFEETARTRQLAAIATAHTMDDQAETVLFRLLRGTGLPGLAGIAPVFETPALLLVRPLLDLPRADLRAWLQSNRLSWREDSSNARSQFARNRIRLELLPKLKRDWNPALSEALARLAGQAQQDEETWKTLLAPVLEAVCPGPAGGFVLHLSTLTVLPASAWPRLFRRILQRLPSAAPDSPSLSAVVALASKPEGHGAIHGPGFTVHRSGSQLLFRPHPAPAPQSAGCPVAGPGLYPSPPAIPAILIEVVDCNEFLPPSETQPSSLYNGCSDFLDGCGFDQPLFLRTWRFGDRFRPLNARSEEKLKDLFQRHQVPSWERASWPILLSGDRIVWARKFGVADWAAARTDSLVVWRIREIGPGLKRL